MKLSSSRIFAVALAAVVGCDAFVPRTLPSFGVGPSSSKLSVATDPTAASTSDSQGVNGAAPSLKDTTVAAVPKVAQRWRKSTKQLATLGPASSTPEMIETLFLAGADNFRLNFSHGSQEQKKELLDMIRSVEVRYLHTWKTLSEQREHNLVVLFFDRKDTFLTCRPSNRDTLTFRRNMLTQLVY